MLVTVACVFNSTSLPIAALCLLRLTCGLDGDTGHASSSGDMVLVGSRTRDPPVTGRDPLGPPGPLFMGRDRTNPTDPDMD